jgi:hypothetical protein
MDHPEAKLLAPAIMWLLTAAFPVSMRASAGSSVASQSSIGFSAGPARPAGDALRGRGATVR